MFFAILKSKNANDKYLSRDRIDVEILWKTKMMTVVALVYGMFGSGSLGGKGKRGQI